MKFGQHGVREHVRMLLPLFGLIAVFWLLRWGLAEMGAAMWVIRLFSVNGSSSLAVVVAVLLIHVRNFGSYANVFLISFLLTLWGELLIILAILFSLLTGMTNIYTAPEFSLPSSDPYHWRHILGHLTFGVGAGTLMGGLMGSLLLWLLRRLVPPRPVR